jgi:hypothetical protein
MSLLPGLVYPPEILMRMKLRGRQVPLSLNTPPAIGIQQWFLVVPHPVYPHTVPSTLPTFL